MINMVTNRMSLLFTWIVRFVTRLKLQSYRRAKNTESMNLYHNLCYPTAPASLQEFALHACALNEYLHKVRFGPPCAEQSCREMKIDHIPAPIQRLIKDRLRSVEKQLKSVFEFLYDNEFGLLSTPRYSCIYQCLTYGADATVDYEATARNLINCSDLTPEEKYAIACQCCFEEDVRRLWPYVSNNRKFKKPDLNRFPLLRYWATRMKHKENVSPTHRDMVRCLRFKPGSWLALAYMWRKSTLKEQLSDVDMIFKTGSYPPDVEKLLTKLTHAQLNHAMLNYPHRAILALSYNRRYFEYLCRLWNHCKVFISDEQFCELVESLFKKGFRIRPSHRYSIWSPRVLTIFRMGSGQKRDRCEDSAYTRSVLYEIWASAKTRSKSAFINSGVEKLFSSISSFSDEKTQIAWRNQDVRFFYSLLADLDFERRNAIWLKYWTVIVIRARVGVLDDFLRLCLMEEDIDLFVKNELMNLNKIGKFMKYLLMQRDNEYVIEYANMCTRRMNKAAGREFRRKLIQFFLRTVLVTELKLKQYINLPNLVNGLSAFPDECNQLMKFILKSHSFWYLADGAESVAIGSNEIAWKNVLLFNHWPRYLLNPDTLEDAELSNNRWKEFWSWCKVQPDNGDVSEFEIHLPIDETFVDMVLAAVEKLTGWLGGLEMRRKEDLLSPSRQLNEFEPVDQFLKSVFGNKKAVRRYKVKFMANCKKWPDFLAIFEGKNECVINDVLKWCFDGDIIEIGNFKCYLLIDEEAAG